MIKKGKVPEDRIRTVLDDLERVCSIVPTTLQTHRLASQLRNEDTLDFWDSLIIPAALEAGCDSLWSEDLQHDRVFANRLRIRNPLLA